MWSWAYELATLIVEEQFERAETPKEIREASKIKEDINREECHK